MLDGYPVKINDTVFVLGVGVGVVTRVTADGGFYVKTSRGENHYRTGGYTGLQRRVYWQDPVFLLPPKNKKLWLAITKLSLTLYKSIVTLCGFEEEEAEEEETPDADKD